MVALFGALLGVVTVASLVAEAKNFASPIEPAVRVVDKDSPSAAKPPRPKGAVQKRERR
jgi:hypothetical protein